MAKMHTLLSQTYKCVHLNFNEEFKLIIYKTKIKLFIHIHFTAGNITDIPTILFLEHNNKECDLFSDLSKKDLLDHSLGMQGEDELTW